MEADYWVSRRRRAPARLIRAIKRMLVSNTVASVPFSMRIDDERFLLKAFKTYGICSVLEVACGAGKEAIGQLPFSVGFDIPGAPMDVARSRGYTETRTYEPTAYEISLDRQVDAIVCCSLNAHIAPEPFERIVGNATKFLAPGGKLVLINEFDNRGVSYRWMRRLDERAWWRVVRGQDHDFLEMEDAFLARFCRNTGFEVLQRTPIYAGLLPALHYQWFLQQRKANASDMTATPSLPSRLALLAMDVPIGIANRFQCAFGNTVGKAHLVGYVLGVDG
jgi:SAM-dependent methyltransferase